MRYVGVRTIKARFCEYINSLDEAGIVIITNNGEPKAMLVPFTHREQKCLIRLDENGLTEAIVNHTVEHHKQMERRLRRFRRDRTDKE